MRARSFLILSAVTIGVTAAAIGAVLQQESPQTIVESGGPIFPGLVGRLGEVGSVVIRDAQHTLTLRRLEGGGWGIAERGDFPVPPEKVRELVSSLVQLEKAEAKTTRPDLYPRLGVEDVGAPESKSKEVTLQTASGMPVAQILVGIAGTGVGAEGATYVRIPGDSQAWLARGTLAPNPEARDWVERRLIQQPTAEIQEVRVVQRDGATLTVVRESGDASGFRLVELPKGAKLDRPDAVEALAATLNEVPLEDLVPLDGIEFPAKGTLRVAATRTDGSKLKMEIVERSGEFWLRFLDGTVPAALPTTAANLAFRIPAWKVTPFERKASDFVESGSGS